MTPPIVGIDLEQYRTKAKDLLGRARAAEPDALELLRTLHPEHETLVSSNQIRLADTQLVVARQHGFPSWAKFKDYLLFRNAVDAVDSGDIGRLGRLLDEHPALIGYRCHVGEWYEQGYFAGASLLNHVAGNPIRCPLPPNIVDIARSVVEYGVDAKDAERTLGLLLTSHQASETGVALPMIDLLVAAGAKLDLTDPNLLTLPLRNQAPLTASALIDRGARIDIRQAAISGRLDLVRDIVSNNVAQGSQARVTALPADQAKAKDLLGEALVWACMAAHTEVAEFLLEAGGVDPGAQDGRKYTGLHYAAASGDLATVQMLLIHGAPLETVNEYGGTVLGQAVWSSVNEPRPEHAAIIERLLAAGADPVAAGYAPETPA